MMPLPNGSSIITRSRGPSRHGRCPDYERDDTADLVQAPEGISAKSLLPILRQRQRVTH
jgi:hypothetical protein